MTKKLFLFCLVVLCLVWAPSSVFALPSVSAEDMAGDCLVMVDGEKELVPVIRDLENRHLFYYAPTRPRLASDGGKPIFNLLKYQRKKSAGSSELVEGGILQFAFSLAIPPDALASLKKDVAKRFNVGESSIKLQPLPMKDANLAVYSPSGNLLGDAPQFPQVAPTFATQLIPVQINLNTLGADVYDELCNGKTGVPVVITFSFEGVTPACGFKATVFWLQSYNHFSGAMEAAGSGSIEAVGVAVGMGVQRALDFLIQKKAVKVESMAGEAMNTKQIESYLGVVLEKIMNEITEVKPPEKVIPANTEAGKPLGLGVGVGYRLKMVNEIKVGQTTFNMSQRLIVDRKSVCGGYIGIGKYPKEVRDSLITTLPAGNWANAYFPLADPGDAAACGVSSIDLTISLADKAGKDLGKGAPKAETAKWTAASGVWKRGSSEVTCFNFPMMSLYAKFKDGVKNLKFALNYQITYTRNGKPSVYKSRQLIPLFDGDFPVPTPLSLVDVVSVFNSFDFSKTSNINTVIFKLEGPVAGRKETVTFSVRDEKPQFLLFDVPMGNKPAPIKATVTFQLKKGKPVIMVVDDVREWGNVISVGDWNLPG